MKVLALFDENGKIHALFHASTQTGAPALRFRPAPGHRVETLEVPSELQHRKLAEIHAEMQVDLGNGPARLVARQRP